MTTSSTPTYAYVKYHDGAKAIVHVSLIKKYSPSSVDDLAKKKMVYWCSTSSQEAKHSDEDFYMADVVELGLTKGDLIRRLVRRKIAIPDFIFDGDTSEAPRLVTHVPSAKKTAQYTKAAHQRKMAGMLSDRATSSDDDADDDVVPKKLLIEEQKKNATLCRKLAILRREKDELQARHDRLEDNLLNRLGEHCAYKLCA